MLSGDEQIKFAIEDARTRQAALVDLIKFNDQKAMTLLSLYVTLGTAAIGLGLTYFGKESFIGAPVAAGLFSAAGSLFVGSMFCFSSVKTQELGLPGRGFDFWDAVYHGQTTDFSRAISTYLIDACESEELLRGANTKGAKDVQTAKAFGIASPAIAFLIGASGSLLHRLISGG